MKRKLFTDQFKNEAYQYAEAIYQILTINGIITIQYGSEIRIEGETPADNRSIGL